MFNRENLYTTVNALRTSITAISTAFPTNVVRDLGVATMALMVEPDHNTDSRKEEIARLNRDFQQFKTKVAEHTSRLETLREELDALYYDDELSTIDFPAGRFLKYDEYKDDEQIEEMVVDACLRSGLMHVSSQNGGFCGGPSYSVNYLYRLTRSIGSFLSYCSLDGRAEALLKARYEATKGCDFGLAAGFKACHQSLMQELDSLQRALDEVYAVVDKIRKTAA